MGEFRVKDSAEFEDGDYGCCVMAVQKEDVGILISSEIGSAYPLYVVRHRDLFEGMVSLPCKARQNPLSIGRIEIRFGDCAQTMLEEFANSTSVNCCEKPAPRCWNSWDYYKSSISYEKIVENACAIAADPDLGENVDCIVLDDGWEVQFGEWEPNSHFKKGMAHTAKEINGLGFRAGLWFAPIVVEPQCNFFQDDYLTVAQNDYGFPDRAFACCGQIGYVLDVTRPGGEAYLRDLFRKYREMGFTYFKLDSCGI